MIELRHTMHRDSELSNADSAVSGCVIFPAPDLHLAFAAPFPLGAAMRSVVVIKVKKQKRVGTRRAWHEKDQEAPRPRRKWDRRGPQAMIA